jgi:NitT/TauT family transport system substrate-binding protein
MTPHSKHPAIPSDRRRSEVLKSRSSRAKAARIGLVPLAAATLVLLAACSSPAKPEATPSSGPAQLIPVTIAYSGQTADEAPLWIAKEGGYFKKNGLDVTLKYLSGNTGVPALLSGQVQVASIGGSDALAAIAQGASIKYVLTLAPVFPFQLWVQPQYDSASKLKGQRVGVTSVSGSQYAATVLALQTLGLKPTDVQITPLGSTPNVDSAMVSKSIAAAASHPPGTSQYAAAGAVDLVNLASKKVPTANSGFAIESTYATAHANVVQKIVDSTVSAIQREKSDKSFTEKTLTKYMGLTDKTQLDATYKFYADNVLVPVPMPTTQQFTATQQALGATNATIKSVKLSSFVDQSFVKKSVKTLGIKK